MLKLNKYYIIILLILIDYILNLIIHNHFNWFESNYSALFYFFYISSVNYKLNSRFSSLNKIEFILLIVSILILLFSFILDNYFIFVMSKLEPSEQYDFQDNNVFYLLNTAIYLLVVAIFLPYLFLKTLISNEQLNVIKVSDYLKDFLFSIFIVTFIWFMIPRINKIAKEII